MSLLRKFDAPANTRLLIVHPDNRTHRRYLSELLRDNSLLYSRFPGANLSLESAEDIVFSQFANHADSKTTPDVYILDECDRLSNEAIHHLLPSLVRYNPIPIIIFSRTIPAKLLEEDDLSQHIEIISKTGKTIMSNDADSPVLEVSGFGVGRVRVNGKDILLTPGDSPHQLFFYLLENPSPIRDEILKQFWSHLDKATAIVSFHVTLRRLSNSLGFKLLYLTGGNYRINPNIVIQYDVQQLRDTLHDSFDNVEASESVFDEAYRLSHHDFLLGCDAEWVIAIRNELREVQADVCVQFAKTAKTPEIALGLYARAFLYNPYREDVARAMMIFYLDNGFPCDALVVYDAIADNLMQRNRIKPGKELMKLMQQAKENCTR